MSESIQISKTPKILPKSLFEEPIISKFLFEQMKYNFKDLKFYRNPKL